VARSSPRTQGASNAQEACGGRAGLGYGTVATCRDPADTFRVERSVSIQAPAEKIFPLIDDFYRWENWAPWEKIDP
jgi:hypothetical protein